MIPRRPDAAGIARLSAFGREMDKIQAGAAAEGRERSLEKLDHCVQRHLALAASQAEHAVIWNARLEREFWIMFETGASAEEMLQDIRCLVNVGVRQEFMTSAIAATLRLAIDAGGDQVAEDILRIASLYLQWSRENINEFGSVVSRSSA